MDVGNLRQIVTVQGPGAVVPDGEGGFTQTYSNLVPAQMPADVRPVTAHDREIFVAGSTVQSTVSHVVTMRYHSGVTTKTRLLFGSRVLDVTGIQNPEERNISLVLSCVERVD